MPKFELKADFWDGRRMHKRGEVLELPEGSAPKKSKRVEEPVAPKPKAKPTDE